MVIYADNIPQAWFGHRYEFKDARNKPHQITVTGVINGNTLMAQNGEATPSPYFNVQGFAMLLLTGSIRQVD